MSCSIHFMTTWLKEPLVHFLFLGMTLFGLYQWLGNSVEDASKVRHEIFVSQGRTRSLAETFHRLWNRPPTQEELEGLVRDYIREEVMYREALGLGLDRDDTIVRRRLAQKMTFFLEDTARLAEPTNEELRRIYDADPKRFQTPARVSFIQIYFNRDRRGEQPTADAKKALAKLSKSGVSADATEFGDRSLLEPEFAEADEQSVRSQFGAEFTRAIFGLEPGQWQGPIESSYGLHLVRVSQQQASRTLDFAEVRNKVTEEWQRRHQQTANEKFFAALLQKYDVVVDESVKSLVGPLVVAKEAGR
jgi:hypothetical protein